MTINSTFSTRNLFSSHFALSSFFPERKHWTFINLMLAQSKKAQNFTTWFTAIYKVSNVFIVVFSFFLIRFRFRGGPFKGSLTPALFRASPQTKMFIYNSFSQVCFYFIFIVLLLSVTIFTLSRTLTHHQQVASLLTSPDFLFRYFFVWELSTDCSIAFMRTLSARRRRKTNQNVRRISARNSSRSIKKNWLKLCFNVLWLMLVFRSCMAIKTEGKSAFF